jgi:hypothetical protein
MKSPPRPFVWVAMATILPAVFAGGVSAAAPRSERVARRIAERAYARKSIAEARAARAEIRVAEIAPFATVPPPPRPATVRRMARAGVPLGGPVGAPPVVAPVAPTVSAAPPGGAVALPLDREATRGGLTDDGTRSVLATAEEPAAAPATREPAGSAVTHPPVELLPTPQPQ